jgi:HEAT repeat protein
MAATRHPILFCALLPLLAAAPRAQAKSPELERARQLLEAIPENEVHQGGELCAQQDNVRAVELLLEVLRRTRAPTAQHLPPGHYRDIVWDYLLRIKDRYARERVELELRTSRDPHVRQWCAELLGIYGDPEFGEPLRKALHDNDEHVQQWAARSLGAMKYQRASADLLAMVAHANDYVRANAIEALARIDAAANAPALAKAIAGDRSGGVRCALLGAAPEVFADRVEELSAGALADADWRPRMQAVENLGRIRSKGAVDGLVRALRDGRPVVAVRAIAELQALTGQKMTVAEAWERWWTDNRQSFTFPEARGTASPPAGSNRTVAYHGVPIDSDHVAFLLDKSVAMEQTLTKTGTPKDQAARDELARVLGLLDEKLVFNVFCYDTEVAAMDKHAVPLTAQTRARAIAFAKAPCRGKAKDIWQALETVIADPTIDTAYLLSSGEPDTGLYVHWNRVTRHLADLDRFHKLVVHTVAYSDNKWFRDQLQKIAEVTGGHFEWAQ